MMMENPQTDPAALAHWWLKVYTPDGGRISQAQYRQMDGACWQLFKYVRKGSGYDPRTNQQWVQVALPPDADVDLAVSELALWLPYIQPTDGYKHVKVFEHTLSEWGSYQLWEYEVNDIRLIVQTYGRQRGVEQFAAWASALDYVRRNHWYGDRA